MSIRNTLIWFILLSLSGCSSLLNPYEEDFACPFTEQGACQSASAAYQQSLSESESGPAEGSTSSPHKIVGYQPKLQPTASLGSPFFPGSARLQVIQLQPIPPKALKDPATQAKVTYQTLTYNKLAGLLKKPGTPVIAPPEVIRVLLLPRVEGEDSTSITMARYRYLILKPSRWVLSDPFGVRP